MYCGKCGNKIPDDARFCNLCGAPVEEDPDDLFTPSGYGKPKKKAGWLIPLAFVLAVLAAAAVVLLLFYSKPELRCKVFGHKWVEPTCTERGYCSVCGERGEDKIPHDFDKKGKCKVCGKKSGERKKKKDKSDTVVETAPAADVPAAVESEPDSPRIGIALPTKDLSRWAHDGEQMSEELVNAGFDVEIYYAANDVETQVNQIYNLVDSGCDVLIIGAIDGSSLFGPLGAAKEKGVAVIAYDRLIYDTDALSYYVTFDNYMVGTVQARYIVEALDLENSPGPFNIEMTTGDPADSNVRYFYDGAMDVLKPYIDEGKLNVMSDQWTIEEVCTPAWSTDEAEHRAADIIKTYYKNADIDAWLCSNDSTALGVENALAENYAGSYPVITGQDCDILNVKNIISGRQSMSVFKDTRILASQAVKMAGQIIQGTNVDVNDTITYNNGVKTVPSFLCECVWADADNYKDILIDSGYYTEDMLMR